VHHVTYRPTGLLTISFRWNPLNYGNVRFDTYVIYAVKYLKYLNCIKIGMNALNFIIPVSHRQIVYGHQVTIREEKG
jgi:hypothetical protein